MTRGSARNHGSRMNSFQKIPNGNSLFIEGTPRAPKIASQFVSPIRALSPLAAQAPARTREFSPGRFRPVKQKTRPMAGFFV
jgi:hypothetical protein